MARPHTRITSPCRPNEVVQSVLRLIRTPVDGTEAADAIIVGQVLRARATEVNHVHTIGRLDGVQPHRRHILFRAGGPRRTPRIWPMPRVRGSRPSGGIKTAGPLAWREHALVPTRHSDGGGPTVPPPGAYIQAQQALATCGVAPRSHSLHGACSTVTALQSPSHSP